VLLFSLSCCLGPTDLLSSIFGLRNHHHPRQHLPESLVDYSVVHTRGCENDYLQDLLSQITDSVLHHAPAVGQVPVGIQILPVLLRLVHAIFVQTIIGVSPHRCSLRFDVSESETAKRERMSWADAN